MWILPLGAFLLPLRRMIDGPGDLHILATMFTRTPPSPHPRHVLTSWYTFTNPLFTFRLVMKTSYVIWDFIIVSSFS